ncbi:MAG: hypothetical protein N3E49_02415 [Bacteroidia bacterium]|nr:hypothetical protein [Bacteroidia bacterium]
MTDKIGRLWLMGLFIALVGLSFYLWWAGSRIKEPSQVTYLTAEATRLLKCPPYLINQGLRLDANQNGIQEYLFSCDSALTTAHQRFIWMEIRKKKVHILLWHTEDGFQVGEGMPGVRAYSWLIDRRAHRLIALPVIGDTFAVPMDILWNPQKDILSFGEPSDWKE